MRIQYVSDLHLHFADLVLPETDADVVVIAGDIDNGYMGIDWVINTATRHDKPFLVVLGNHEHYGQHIHKVVPHWERRIASSPAAELVHILDRANPSIIVEDVLFLGSTLWTDMDKGDPLALAMTNYGMMDFRRIKIRKSGIYGGRLFRSEDSVIEHHKTLDAFRGARDDAWELPLVVISHHAPSYKSIDQEFKDTSNLNGAYYSELEDIMEELRVSLWIHGHVHTSFDYMTNSNRTRVVCNPRGYSGYESQARHYFEADKVVTV